MTTLKCQLEKLKTKNRPATGDAWGREVERILDGIIDVIGGLSADVLESRPVDGGAEKTMTRPGGAAARKDAGPVAAGSGLRPRGESPSSAIESAVEKLQAGGFRGERGTVICEAEDERGFHRLRVVGYHFDGSPPVLYIEVEEDPEHSTAPARIYSFSAAVHALQNLRDEEVWTVGNRETGTPPPEGARLSEEVGCSPEEAMAVFREVGAELSEEARSMFGTPSALIPEGAVEFESERMRALRIPEGSIRIVSDSAWQFATHDDPEFYPRDFRPSHFGTGSIAQPSDPHWTDVAASWLRHHMALYPYTEEGEKPDPGCDRCGGTGNAIVSSEHNTRVEVCGCVSGIESLLEKDTAKETEEEWHGETDHDSFCFRWSDGDRMEVVPTSRDLFRLYDHDGREAAVSGELSSADWQWDEMPKDARDWLKGRWGDRGSPAGDDAAEETEPGTCPRCGSNKPHLHPAVQEGGEVSPCADDFHRRVTPENTPARIAKVQDMLRATSQGSEETEPGDALDGRDPIAMLDDYEQNAPFSSPCLRNIIGIMREERARNAKRVEELEGRLTAIRQHCAKVSGVVNDGVPVVAPNVVYLADSILELAKGRKLADDPSPPKSDAETIAELESKLGIFGELTEVANGIWAREESTVREFAEQMHRVAPSKEVTSLREQVASLESQLEEAGKREEEIQKSSLRQAQEDDDSHVAELDEFHMSVAAVVGMVDDGDSMPEPAEQSELLERLAALVEAEAERDTLRRERDEARAELSNANQRIKAESAARAEWSAKAGRLESNLAEVTRRFEGMRGELSSLYNSPWGEKASRYIDDGISSILARFPLPTEAPAIVWMDAPENPSAGWYWVRVYGDDNLCVVDAEQLRDMVTGNTDDEGNCVLEWVVPNFARTNDQRVAYRLSDLDPEDLDDLCNRFRAEVFRKAGKGDPAYPAPPEPEQGEG